MTSSGWFKGRCYICRYKYDNENTLGTSDDIGSRRSGWRYNRHWVDTFSVSGCSTGSSTWGISTGCGISAGRNANGMAAGFKVDLEGCGEGEGGVSRLGSVSAPGKLNSSSDSSPLSLKAGGCPVESLQASCGLSIPTVALFRAVTSLSVAPGEPLENPALHKTVRRRQDLNPDCSGRTLDSSQMMP